MRRMASVLMNAVQTLSSPIRWVNRLSGKQSAGLFLVVLWFLPAIPARALDPGPVAPTSTGGQVPTAANSSVVGNTGTFSTGVEIDLPPGRMGMAPKLSLGYASGGGNGPMGVGWSMPMTSIVRVGYRKGVPGPAVDFDRDEFYLNLNGSAARLLPVPLPGSTDMVSIVENCSVVSALAQEPNATQNGNGNHDAVGADNVPTNYCVRRYHTEVESWAKVEGFFGRMPKGPGSAEFTSDPSKLFFWLVTTKTGSEMTLGTTADSRLCDQNAVCTYGWYLAKMKDTHGNTIRYEYTTGLQSAGYLYYRAIHYTGHDDATGAEDITPHFHVLFTLESRTDFTTSYRPGYLQVMGERYRDIYIVDDANYSGTPINAINLYRVEYAQSQMTGRSLVRIIRHYGKSSIYGGVIAPGPKYPVDTYHYSAESELPRGWYGDSDLAASFLKDSTVGIPFSNAFSFHSHDWGARLADVNGDGLPDKVDDFVDQYANQSFNQLRLNTGKGFKAVPGYIPGSPFDIKESNGRQVDDQGTRIYDINGDGIPDKIDHGNGKGIYLGTGNGFSSAPPFGVSMPQGYPLGVAKLPTTSSSFTSSAPPVPADPLPCDPANNPKCSPPKVGRFKVISGPTVSSGPISYNSTVHFQIVNLGDLGIIRTLTSDTAPGVTIRPQAGYPFELAVYSGLADDNYTLNISSGYGKNGQAQTIHFSVQNSQPLPVARFAGLPAEGVAEFLPFEWACANCATVSPASAIQYSYTLDSFSSPYTQYSVSPSATSPLVNMVGVWLKVKLNDVESVPAFWPIDVRGLEIPFDILKFAEYVNRGVGTILDHGSRIADLNGDGLPDLITAQYSSGLGFWYKVYLQYPSGQYVYAPNWSKPYDFAFSNLNNELQPDINTTPTGFELQDVNGDGLADLIISKAESHDGILTFTQNAVYLNNGRGFNPATGTNIPSGYANTPWPAIGNNSSCAFCSGGGAGASYSPSTGASPSATLSLYTQNPDATFISRIRTSFPPIVEPLQPAGSRYIDINGDGLPDLIVNYTTPYPRRAVYINTGAGFVQQNNINLPIDFMTFDSDGAQDNSVQCDDFTGSGLPDCLFYKGYESSSSGKAYYRNQNFDHSTQAFGTVPDLLIQIENGFGGTTTVSYKPSSAYLPGQPDAVPADAAVTTFMPFTQQLVSTITASDGMGQSYTTLYRYAGGFFDKRRHEFRGFRVVRTYEAVQSAQPKADSSAYVDSYFRLDWPFAGMLDYSAAYQNTGNDAYGQVLARSWVQYRKREFRTLAAQNRIFVEKTKDRTDVYETDLPGFSGALPSNFSYRYTTANEYDYDGMGNAARMHSLGLVLPVQFTRSSIIACTAANPDCPFDYSNPSLDDDAGTLTQYINQGDEPGMTPGPWRVGMIRSSQSFKLPPTDDYTEKDPASYLPKDPYRGVMTATRVCYDGTSAGCSYGGAIDKGDITHSSTWLDKPGIDATGTLRAGNRWIVGVTRFNPLGQIDTVTDPMGNSTRYTYAALGGSLLDSITDAQGNRSIYAYNEAGLLSRSVDINGVAQTYEYDLNWRPVKTFIPDMDAVNPTTEYVYNLTGVPGTQYVATRKLLDWGSPVKLEVRSYFDGMERAFAKVGPDPDPARAAAGSGVWSLSFWDAQGRQLDAYRPFRAAYAGAPPTLADLQAAKQPKTHFTYDLKKRVVRTDYPDGTRAITLPVAVADPLGGASALPADLAIDGKNHWVMHIKDGNGRVVRMRENRADSTGDFNVFYETKYAYDPIGRLTGVIDPKGNSLISGLEYDTLGRKLAITDADTGSGKWVYDDGGRPRQETDARGVVATLTYDSLNRPLRKTFEVSGAPTVHPLAPVDFSYGTNPSLSNVGRLVTRSDDAGTESFLYDRIGEPVTATRRIAVAGGNYSFTVSRAYNAQGQVKSLTYPDGYTLTNDYAANGALARVRGRQGSNPQTVFATYDQFNEVGQLLNGAVMDGKVARHFEYDFATGRPLEQRDSHVMTTGALQDLIYFAGFNPQQPSILAYDEVGNLTFAVGSQRQKDGTYRDTSQEFHYDALNRLSAATGTSTYGTLSYAYDESGNLTTKDGKSYTYDGTKLHAVVSRTLGATTESYAYDNAGNMTSAPGLGLTWDAAGRPWSVAHASKGATLNYRYTYDDGGGRVLKESTGHADPGKDYTRVYLGNLYEVQVEPGVGGVPVFTHTKHIFAGTKRIATITETANSVNFAAAMNYQTHRQSADAIQMAMNQSKGPGVNGWGFSATSSPRSFDLHHPLSSLVGFARAIHAAQRGALSWVKAHAALDYHRGAIQYAQHAAEINFLLTLTLAFSLLGVGGWLAHRHARRLLASRREKGNRLGRPIRLIPGLPRWLSAPIGALTLTGFILQMVLMTGVTIPSYAQAAALNASATPAGLPVGTFYYLTNHLGSSTVILDDQANVIETDAYKPFGELWDDGSGASKDHRFYFTGAEKEEFDLYQFGARWYSPDVGRFISADSIVPDPTDSQQFNRYSYTSNNPINATDPSGHDFGIITGIIIGAIVGALAAAATGGNVVQGAVMGAFFGALGASGLEWYAQGAISAGVSAAQAADQGGQAMATAALLGFASSAIGHYMGGSDVIGRQVAMVYVGMGLAGIGAAVGGGNVGAAIASAFVGGVVGAIANDAADAIYHAETASSYRKKELLAPDKKRTERILKQYELPAPGTMVGPFNSPDAAAEAAIDKYAPIGLKEDLEFAGSVVKYAGVWYYTAGLPGTAFESEPAATIWKNNMQLIGRDFEYADWHSHGSLKLGEPKYYGEGINNRGFSRHDTVSLSDPYGRHVIGYVGTPSGRVLRYVPRNAHDYILEEFRSIYGKPVYNKSIQIRGSTLCGNVGSGC